MAYYDSSNRILCGRRIPQIYDDYTSIGQVAMYSLIDHQNKVLQLNDDDGVELTGGQLKEMMLNIAKNLYRIGMRSGDIAGLCVSNTTYVTPLVFGCLLLRLPINPVDKLFDASQISKIFVKTKPKIIFCDHDCVDKIINVLEITRIDAIIVTLTERIAGFNYIFELLSECHLEYDGFIYSKPANLIPAFIVCTSGSTGEAKLALISHLQLLQHNFWFEELAPQKLSFCPASLFWLLGFCHIIFKVLNGYNRLITSKPFTPDLFFDLIEKYEINETILYTPILKLLIESPRFERADFSKFDMISSPAFCIPKSYCDIFLKKLPNGIFAVGYGASEVGGVTYKIVNSKSTSSVGGPCVNTEIKIQLDDGTTSFIKEIGEVLVRQKAKFHGYLNNNPAAKIDDEGWYHTGDMGYIDENYELNIVGQRTQVIRSIHGEIYPFEIETRIEAIRGVKRVVIVGTPHLTELYIPTALIIKDSNSDVNEEIINEAISDMAPHQQLTGGIFFVDELPMSRDGKIQRNEAKEIATRLKFQRDNAQNQV